MPTKEELAAVAVGDTVLVYPDSGAYSRRRHEPRECTVAKIGRTLIYIDDKYGTPSAFHRDTQCRRDGWPGRFMTKAQAADETRRDAALGDLRVLGWESTNAFDQGLWSTDQLVSLVGFATHLRVMDQQSLARPVTEYDIADIADPRDIDLHCVCFRAASLCSQHQIPLDVRVRQLLRDYAALATRYEKLERGEDVGY